MTDTPKVSERAKGLISEAMNDIQKSHQCSRDAAANLVSAFAMVSAPVETDLIDDWLEEAE